MLDKKPKFIRNRFIAYFASIRFAIPVLMAYTAAMILGTVLESLHGTDYATVAVYRSPWFYAILGSIALSVFLAMVDRIPLRKRLTGFYVIHCALITILVGGGVTRYWGIDGTIELSQGRFTSQVNLAEDRIYVDGDGAQISMPLAPAIRPIDFTERQAPGASTPSGARVRPLRFLPYARPETVWRPRPGVWVSEWVLRNDRFTQPVEFANVPLDGIVTGGEIGALRAEVISPELFRFFSKNLGVTGSRPGDLVFHDSSTGAVRRIDSRRLSAGQSEKLRLGGVDYTLSEEMIEKIGLSVVRLRSIAGQWSFFPRFSAAPVTKHLQTDEKAPYRIYEVGSLGKKSSLFLSRDEQGKVWVGYGKGREWKFAGYPGHPVSLPWMGLSIELRGERLDEAPVTLFSPAEANKDAAKNIRAVLLRVETPDGKFEELWASDRTSVRSSLESLDLAIGKEAIRLPFELELEQFKMDQIPGTGMPASYESFVKVRDAGASAASPASNEKSVHVYMNNPYKAAGFTLYQSSFYQDERGAYHSVLSVNRDPGRPIKYAGALLLVLGLIIHYLVLHGHLFAPKRKANSS